MLLNISGVFPHLAQVADLGPPRTEIGVGALMPWAGVLYVQIYNSDREDSGHGVSLPGSGMTCPWTSCSALLA